MSIADLNGDTLLDIKFYLTQDNGYEWYGTTASFYNQGNGGGYDVPDSIGSGGGNSYWGSVIDIDVNNDGVKDTFFEELNKTVTGQYYSDCLNGYISQPDGTRTHLDSIICSSSSLPSYQFIDLDGDGDLEMVIREKSGGCGSCVNATIRWAGYLGFYENNGSGFEWRSKVIVYEKDNGFLEFNGADLNGDGKGEIFGWDNSQWNDSTLQLFEQPLE